MRRICLPAAMAVFVFALTIPAYAVGYPGDGAVPSDMEPRRWSYAYVAQVVAEGWMDVDRGGTFRPSEPATYAEFCMALERAFLRGPDADPGEETTLPDWYRGVSGVAGTGALEGTVMSDPDSWDDHVHDAVDRSVMAIVTDRLVRRLDLVDPNTGYGANGGEFDEMDPEAVSAFLECMSLGLVSGYPDGSLGYADPMTREQCAAVICRLASLVDDLSVEWQVSGKASCS